MKVMICFNFVLELVKYPLMMYVLFRAKIRRKWFIGGAVVLYTALLLTGVLPTENLQILSYITVAMVNIILLVIVDIPIKSRFFNILKAFFILICVDFAVGGLLNIVENNIFSVNVPTVEKWIISNIISGLVLSIICWEKKTRFMENKRWAKPLKKGAIYTCIVIMALAIPLTITGLTYMAEKVNDPVLMGEIQILTVVFFFSMIALAMFIIYVNDTNKKMKKYLEMERTLKDTQKSYYEAMLSKEEDTRRFRHDVLNHLICIRELVAKGEIEPVTAYVEQMQGDIVEIQQKCYSVGNIIIDAFLNYYVQMLEADVDVRITGCLAEEVSISDLELCTIFSNLIKNSVEELKKPGEGRKYLEVKVNSGQQAFQIEVSNSISKQLKETKENLPETTKEDKKNHGIGLRNVKETIEKNHGTFQWKREESSFKTVVTLPLKSNI